MKADLNELAARIARRDDPAGLNLDVVQVKAVLAGLGQELRALGPEEAAELAWAVYSRAGRGGKGEKETAKDAMSAEGFGEETAADTDDRQEGSGR